jgi:uncharacterized coiled-coil DUF342 family protein
MKRTPDFVSKKRQELSRQIETLQSIINNLTMSTTFTQEQMQSKTNKLNEYNRQLKDCKQELYETHKIGRHFNINYRKKLHPGVF